MNLLLVHRKGTLTVRFRERIGTSLTGVKIYARESTFFPPVGMIAGIWKRDWKYEVESEYVLPA